MLNVTVNVREHADNQSQYGIGDKSRNVVYIKYTSANGRLPAQRLRNDDIFYELLIIQTKNRCGVFNSAFFRPWPSTDLKMT